MSVYYVYECSQQLKKANLPEIHESFLGDQMAETDIRIKLYKCVA